MTLALNQLSNHITMNSKAKDSVSIELSDMFVNVKSNTQGLKAELSSKSSFSDINISSDILNISASNFNYNVDVLDVDKDSLEDLRGLLSKSRTNNSIALLSMIKNTTVDMLSKGLKINIKDLSVKDINLNGENLKGFSLESKLNLKEDKLLSKKIDYAPLFIAQNPEL